MLIDIDRKRTKFREFRESMELQFEMFNWEKSNYDNLPQCVDSYYNGCSIGLSIRDLESPG